MAKSNFQSMLLASCSDFARVLAFAEALRRCRSGVATIELAICLPVLVTLGMYGTEIAYMAAANMKVSQLALSVADNASRLGQTDNSAVTPTVTEADVDSIMFGALQQGSTFDFENKGRVILTSLERDAFTGKQFIHWQRCVGNLSRTSSYGNDTTNNGLVGPTLAGMGAVGHRITANDGTAVMFAEVYYNYTGLFGTFFSRNMVFKQEAGFIVRDDRNMGPGITGAAGGSAC
jgi:Flp pilus assembly protein TadG